MKASEDTPKSTWKYWLFTICFFGIFVVLLLITEWIRYQNRFILEDHYEDTIVSVSQDSGTLGYSVREFGYYILIMERDVQQDALAYNPANPIEYWNLHLGNGEELGYIRNMSRRYATQYAIRDLIFYDQARRAGISLTEEEEIHARMDAADLISDDFPIEKLDAVAMTEEMFYAVSLRVAVSKKYTDQLMAEGNQAEDLDLEGSYYLSILEQYQTTQNDEVLSHLVFGSISVN